VKILLVDVAAKYIHAPLALRYLRESCRDLAAEVVLLEQTVNQPLDQIIAAIYREEPTVVGFSCYIWNIAVVIPVIKALKKIAPQVRIVCGGPEVSYDNVALMGIHPYIDYIISGEGEVPFRALMGHLLVGNPPLNQIAGISWREGDHVEYTQSITFQNLNHVPKPYSADTPATLANRIVYYEASRGCPYRCAYCLSGLAGKVRTLPMERIKEELHDLAVVKGVKQIKFVDRTFNTNRKFTLEMFHYLKELPTDTNFHFEMRAELLDDEIIDVLRDVPLGKFQFEIGIQSTNSATLAAVNRRDDWSKIKHNVLAVNKLGNIHQHLDLIAGLPEEDYASFGQSFNDVYTLRPDMLQLGFLKLIKGSELWRSRQEYNYMVRDYPPFEVLSAPCLSYAELLVLKDVEEIVETYYNSGNFPHTLSALVDREDAFAFYEKISTYFRREGFFEQRHSLENQFEILYDFIIAEGYEKKDYYRELLKLDFLCHFRHRKLPEWMQHREMPTYKQTLFDLLGRESVLNLLASELRTLAPREILKQVHLEIFNCDVTAIYSIEPVPTAILFDYSHQHKAWFNRKAHFTKITI